MPSGIYGAALRNTATGAIDFDTDTFWVLLTTSAYAEDFDTHDFRNDVTNEVVGAGYTSGGQAVTVTVNAYDTTNNRLDITLGGTSWASSTITARKAVYYKRRGGAASADELVAVVEFPADVSTTSGTFTLTASTLRIQN
jgi:hypothetical protein